MIQLHTVLPEYNSVQLSTNSFINQMGRSLTLEVRKEKQI